MCMILCCSEIQDSHMVAQKQARGLRVGMCKKLKDQSAQESKERGHGKGVGVYATLLQSDTGQPYGRAKAGTRPVGVERHKKTKDLSASERVECGYGEGVSTDDVRESACGMMFTKGGPPYLTVNRLRDPAGSLHARPGLAIMAKTLRLWSARH